MSAPAIQVVSSPVRACDSTAPQSTHWNGARSNGLGMCTAGGYYRTFVGNNKNGKIVKSEKFLFVNTVSETQKGEGKKERHPQNVVTRATNAARVRPEDDSTFVTTLFELTGFEFLILCISIVKS